MNFYEIMLSESQERMLQCKGREHELEEVFEKWDLHAAQIGEVKMVIVWWSDIKV